MRFCFEPLVVPPFLIWDEVQLPTRRRVNSASPINREIRVMLPTVLPHRLLPLPNRKRNVTMSS